MKKNEVILFLPNGFGDVIMASRSINELEGYYRIVKVITLSKSHSRFFKTISKKNVEIVERYSGKKFSQLRLFFNLLFDSRSIIVAPLISKKRINLFFLMLLFNKKIIVPKGFIAKNYFNLQEHEYNINSYVGHQVNYLASYFSDKSLGPKKCNYRSLESNVIKICVGISCGKVERHKIPSPEWFAKALNLVSKDVKLEVVIIGTTNDLELIDLFSSKLHKNILLTKLIDLDLEKLILEIKKCHIGFAGTTGQSHIMSLVDIPQAIVCGVTNPFESGPFIDTVASIKHNLSCGPCYQDKFIEGCRLITCMEEINVSDAAKTVVELLKFPERFQRWFIEKRVNTRTLDDIEKILKIKINQ